MIDTRWSVVLHGLVSGQLGGHTQMMMAIMLVPAVAVQASQAEPEHSATQVLNLPRAGNACGLVLFGVCVNWYNQWHVRAAGRAPGAIDLLDLKRSTATCC